MAPFFAVSKKKLKQLSCVCNRVGQASNICCNNRIVTLICNHNLICIINIVLKFELRDFRTPRIILPPISSSPKCSFPLAFSDYSILHTLRIPPMCATVPAYLIYYTITLLYMVVNTKGSSCTLFRLLLISLYYVKIISSASCRAKSRVFSP
jgi:hypothetical protein